MQPLFQDGAYEKWRNFVTDVNLVKTALKSLDEAEMPCSSLYVKKYHQLYVEKSFRFVQLKNCHVPKGRL